LAVMVSIRFPLLPRNVEDLLLERVIDISHETAKFWQTGSVRCLPLKFLRRVHEITRALMR
jgi:transposase-like protein